MFRCQRSGFRSQIFVFAALFAACASAQLDVAVIDLESDVDSIRYARTAEEFDRLKPIRFYQAESVRFDVAALHGDVPVALTNAGVFVRWEAYAEAGSTNAYIHKTGTVVSATGGVVRIDLTPEESNLPAGSYYSFVRAFQPVGGTNRYIGVLAYNRLEVIWSPDTLAYDYRGPWPLVVYTNMTPADLAEILDSIGAVSGRVSAVEVKTNDWNTAFSWGNHREAKYADAATVSGQVVSVSGRVDQVELDITDITGRVSRVESGTNLWNGAASTATNNADRITTLEAGTNLWNTVTDKVDTVTQTAINSNLEARVTDLEARPVVDTNLTVRVDALETNVVYRADLDGDWYFPEWFQWTFSQVADALPDSTSTITNKDVVIERNIYDNAGSSYEINYTGLRSSDFSSPAVTSSSPSVATCTVDKVWYIAQGTTTVSAVLGDFSRSTNLTMSLVSSITNDVLIGCTTGSAVCAFAAGIDSRLGDGSDTAVYSTLDHAATNYVRNTNSWVADLDLTCVSPWNSTGGGLRAGTLIGSDCIVFAQHFQISVGATVRFVTSSNTVISRTLLSTSGSVYGDWAVGRLSSAISTNDCRPALLLDVYESEYMPYTSPYRDLRPALWIDQTENAYVTDLATVMWAPLPTTSPRSLYAKQPVVGDSGSPVLLIAEQFDVPIFCGTYWSAMGALGSTVSYNAQIRAAAAALGCDTDTIINASFSAAGYPNYVAPPTPN